MKTIKPLSISLLHRVLEDRHRPYLHLGVLVPFDLMQPRRILTEVKLWKAAAIAVPGGVLDEGLAKPASELLVAGAHVAPAGKDGEPFVRIRLGAIDKRLDVRSDPGLTGLGPIPIADPRRQSLVGTEYGTDWQENQMPGLARDHDPRFFHLAPEDQRARGYFRGDEAFLVDRMHPDRPALSGALPPLAARAFVTRAAAPDELTEIHLRLETVWLLPGEELGVLLFRGVTEITTDDASELAHLVLGTEDRASPRAKSHYADVLRGRLDKEHGALAALDDSPLIPSLDDGWSVETLAELAVLPDHGGHLAKNLARRKAALHDKARADWIASGRDPKELELEEDEPEAIPDLTDPRALAAFTKVLRTRLSNLEAEVATKKEAALAKVRGAAKEQGIDVDAAAPPEARAPGPPDFSKVAEGIAALRERGGLDDAMHERMTALGDRAHEAYALGAHYLPEPRLLDKASAARGRERLLELRASGGSFAKVDLSGADLDGLDLAGLDLSGVFLEGASLVGAELRGARLDGAVLARADLTDARLARVSALGTNFGASIATRTDLSDADLRRSVWSKAGLDGTVFRRAKLEGAALLECVMGAPPDFSEIIAPKLQLVRVGFGGARFSGALLERAAFVECDLTGARFDGAKLGRASFVTVKGAAACFDEADLGRAFVGHGSSFGRATFRGARLSEASLRGAELSGADFSAADLTRADVSGATLSGARMSGIRARSARLIGTDLRGASLDAADLLGALLPKADLRGASLRGACLYQSDMSRVRLGLHLGRKTVIDGALTELAKVHPMRKELGHGS